MLGSDAIGGLPAVEVQKCCREHALLRCRDVAVHDVAVHALFLCMMLLYIHSCCRDVAVHDVAVSMHC